ncbi:MAG: c-type cytochrome domain-containing protein, partial [Bacteroidota bacterium]
MRNLSILLVFLAGTWVSSCGPNLPDDVKMTYAKLPNRVDFNLDVKPILSDKCFACHGPDKGKIEAGLQLHAAKAAFAELSESPGKFAIVPGKLEESEAFHRILTEDPNLVMPPPNSHLN